MFCLRLWILTSFFITTSVRLARSEEEAPPTGSFRSRDLERGTVKPDFFLFTKVSYCRPNGNGRFETVESRTAILAFLLGWRRGTCGNLCTEVCNHQPCMEDFIVSSDSQGCQCIENVEPKTCGENAVCKNDECECLTGLKGDPLIKCFKYDSLDPTKTIKPTPTPTQTPISTTTSTPTQTESSTDCSNGTCFTSSPSITLTISTIGLTSYADAYIYDASDNNLATLINIGNKVMSHSFGRQPTLRVVVEDMSLKYEMTSLDCSSGECSISVPTSTLTINATGSSMYTDAYLYTSSGSYIETFLYVGNKVSSYSFIFQSSVRVLIKYSALSYQVDDLDCSSGECSISVPTSTLTIDATGLSMYADAYLYTASGSLFETILYVGNKVSSYSFILQSNISVAVVDGSQRYEVNGLDCSSGECKFSVLTSLP